MGAIDIEQSHVVRKERLRPGKILLIDTVKGCLVSDEELKEYYAARQPYGEWLDSNLIELRELSIPNKGVPAMSREERAKLQKTYGYTYEEYKTMLLPMALNGSEAVSAMGADSPLAVLSKNTSLFSTISNSSLPRSPTRPLTPFVKKSLPLPRFMWARKGTSWRRQQKTVRY